MTLFVLGFVLGGCLGLLVGVLVRKVDDESELELIVDCDEESELDLADTQPCTTRRRS